MANVWGIMIYEDCMQCISGRMAATCISMQTLLKYNQMHLNCTQNLVRYLASIEMECLASTVSEDCHAEQESLVRKYPHPLIGEAYIHVSSLSSNQPYHHLIIDKGFEP